MQKLSLTIVTLSVVFSLIFSACTQTPTPVAPAASIVEEATVVPDVSRVTPTPAANVDPSLQNAIALVLQAETMQYNEVCHNVAGSKIRLHMANLVETSHPTVLKTVSDEFHELFFVDPDEKTSELFVVWYDQGRFWAQQLIVPENPTTLDTLSNDGLKSVVVAKVYPAIGTLNLVCPENWQPWYQYSGPHTVTEGDLKVGIDYGVDRYTRNNMTQPQSYRITDISNSQGALSFRIYPDVEKVCDTQEVDFDQFKSAMRIMYPDGEFYLEIEDVSDSSKCQNDDIILYLKISVRLID